MFPQINRTRSRTAKWNLFFLYTTIVYNIIIAVVLVPLYLKYIPKDVYGYWLASGNILAWLTVIDPGFSAVVEQKVAFNYGAKNFDNVGHYSTASLFIGIAFILIIVAGGIFFSFNFTGWLNVTDKSAARDLISAFNFALGGTAFMLLSYTLVSINKGLQSSLGTGLIFSFVNVSSIILLIVLLNNGYGIVSLGIALFWRGIVFVIGNVVYMTWRLKGEKIKLSFKKSVFKDFTSLMSFNFLGKIGSTLSTQLSSFVTARFLSPVDVTVLKFTQSAPEMSKLILVRPSVAITSPLTHLIGEKEEDKAKSILIKLFRFLTWGAGLFFCCFIILNESFIDLWVGKEFYAGGIINVVIVLLVVVTSFTNSIVPIVFALGNIKKTSIVIFVQGIFYVLLLLLGVNFFGLLGVVAAALIAELISLWYFPKNLFERIKISGKEKAALIKELIKCLSISILLIVISYIIKIENPDWFTFIFQTAILVVTYFIILFGISSLFRNNIISIIHKLKT